MQPVGFHIPSQTPGAKVSVYSAPGTRHVWQKPRGVSMVHMYVVGGGATGGYGRAAGLATARGGGGGGGSGAVSSGIFPAYLIPDILYVTLSNRSFPSFGLGSDGGTTFIASSTGAYSDVVNSTFLVATGGTAGANTSTGTGGTGGTGAITPSLDTMPLGMLGILRLIPGQNGAAGGTNAAGGSVTPYASLAFTVGGAGGGGIDVANTSFGGGDVNGVGNMSTIPGGAAIGGHGSDGTCSRFPNMPTGREPFRFLGGSGGGARPGSGNVGGRGGAGSFGCGGGGSGGAFTALLSDPGAGGGGFALIACW